MCFLKFAGFTHTILQCCSCIACMRASVFLQGVLTRMCNIVVAFSSALPMFITCMCWEVLQLTYACTTYCATSTLRQVNITRALNLARVRNVNITLALSLASVRNFEHISRANEHCKCRGHERRSRCCSVMLVKRKTYKKSTP